MAFAVLLGLLAEGMGSVVMLVRSGRFEGTIALTFFSANTLVEKQRTSLVEAHKNGCPWKARQCDGRNQNPKSIRSLIATLDSIYCTPLQSPGAMIREIKGRADAMDSVIKDILIKHPLVCATVLNDLTVSFI